MNVPESRSLADAIARDHGRSLRRFVAARLRGAKHAIDDVVQEVYLRIIRRREQETVRNPEAYVIQVAAHTLHDMGHAKAHTDGGPVRLASDGPEAWASEDPVAQADAQRRVEQAEQILQELPPRVYASFLLYRVHGMNHEKIARLHGVHPNTVKNDIKQAVGHLTRRLGREPA